MAWGNWSRSKSETPGAVVGLDLNATRARAAYGQADGGPPRSLPLEDPHPDLPLVISLEKRAPEVGRSGLGLIRRLPHLVVRDFLPALGQNRTWTAGRHHLDAAGAIALVAERLKPAFAGQHGLAAIVPAYLSMPQVAKLTSALERARLPILGTATLPLAVAATHAPPSTSEGALGWGFGTALVVDIDGHALTWTVLTEDGTNIRVVTTLTLPTLSERVWLDRVLSAVSDRCVRLCRRDPRDSAGAEQALYEQIDAILDPAHLSHAVTFSVRTDHWFQTVSVQPDEMDGFCAALAKATVDGMRQALAQAHTVVPATAPPTVVWVAPGVARLPGMVSALAANLPETSAVRVLQLEAIAHSAHALACAWRHGGLPRGHLDATAPILKAVPDQDLMPPISVTVSARTRK
jgi:hypothetical protein